MNSDMLLLTTSLSIRRLKARKRSGLSRWTKPSLEEIVAGEIFRLQLFGIGSLYAEKTVNSAPVVLVQGLPDLQPEDVGTSAVDGCRKIFTSS